MEKATRGRLAEAMNEAPNEAPRPAMREELRSESSQDRAARRAAELRGHLGEMDEGTDKFYVPPDIIPDGWTYEWKRMTIYNQADPSHQVQLARMGWEAVPTSRHPEMMPMSGDHPYIARDGMILMERPTEIVNEARAASLREARMQVRHKEEQIAGTPDGTMTRDHARVKPKISKGYEPIPIPGD
tara:strand:- start:1257 stop:1814 length:558 start_codon:yes stop_codon:yes gene_type:complete